MPLDYFTPAKAADAVDDRREVRRKLADAIAQFMRGRIDNFAFDDAVWKAAAADRSLGKLPMSLWMLYDDFTRHLISVDRRGWQFLRRCIAYLLTTERPVPDFHRKRTDIRLWPFVSWRAVRAAYPAFKTIDLPDYDPAVHHRKVRWWDVKLGPGWLWAALLMIAVAALIVGSSLIR